MSHHSLEIPGRGERRGPAASASLPRRDPVTSSHPQEALVGYKPSPRRDLECSLPASLKYVTLSHLAETTWDLPPGTKRFQGFS